MSNNNFLIYYACFHENDTKSIIKITIQYIDNIDNNLYNITFWKSDSVDTHTLYNLNSIFDIVVFNVHMKLFLFGTKIIGCGKSRFFYGYSIYSVPIETFLCIGCKENQCNQLAHTCLGNQY